MKQMSYNTHMLKKIPWQIWLGCMLVLSSALLYFEHYLIFRDAHHIFIYMFGDIAFLPLEVLFVSMIIHQVLEKREKQEKLHKLNMLIGAFFTETGSELMYRMTQLDSVKHLLQVEFEHDKEWTAKDLIKTEKELKNHKCALEYNGEKVEGLKDFLDSKRKFLLNLLGNQNLLEHNAFTALLWSVFHTTEELLRRKNLAKNSIEDQKHILTDIQRGYKLIIIEWFSYIKHLHADYPYLFKFELRANPFKDRLCNEKYCLE